MQCLIACSLSPRPSGKWTQKVSCLVEKSTCPGGVWCTLLKPDDHIINLAKLIWYRIHRTELGFVYIINTLPYIWDSSKICSSTPLKHAGKNSQQYLMQISMDTQTVYWLKISVTTTRVKCVILTDNHIFVTHMRWNLKFVEESSSFCLGRSIRNCNDTMGFKTIHDITWKC